MPLSRALVQAEQALASPRLAEADLLSTNPRASLEHASQARVVGLAHQLADLAEFSASLFERLNAEVEAVRSRGEAVSARVATLESVIGRVEEEILKDTDPLAAVKNPALDFNPRVNAANSSIVAARPYFLSAPYDEAAPRRLLAGLGTETPARSTA